MLELVFCESAGGSLMSAKKLKRGTQPHAAIGVIGEVDFSFESILPKIYNGPELEGEPGDVVTLGFHGDIGDITDLEDVDLRGDLYYQIYFDAQHYFEDDQHMEENKKANLDYMHCLKASILRVKKAAAAKEPIRVWWSDSPSESCGFYWAMQLLQDSDAPTSHIKIPRLLQHKDGYKTINGIGELLPEEIPAMTAYEIKLPKAERKTYAAVWDQLILENAPLRSNVNGLLVSVPFNFYDYTLQAAFSENEIDIGTAIGMALEKSSFGMWWYTKRIEAMLSAGELEIIKKGKEFFSNVVKRNPSF